MTEQKQPPTFAEAMASWKARYKELIDSGLTQNAFNFAHNCASRIGAWAELIERGKKHTPDFLVKITYPELRIEQDNFRALKYDAEKLLLIDNSQKMAG